jgi:cell division protein FtsQ
MKKFKKILTITGLLGCLALGIFGIISATINQGSKRCKGINVTIKDNSSQFLVSDTDVKKWATNYGNEPLEGRIIRNIDLRNIEKKVLSSGYIRSCEAFFDVKGNINIETEVYKPVARVLMGGQIPDKLIDASGKVFPMSARFSPTLMLIGGEYFLELDNQKASKNADLIKFINYIANDDFWQAQITQISIDKNKEITLYPHMGEQTVEFGSPEKVEAKFDKLLTFYKSILPMSQWSSFKKISLKYESQIVCN